jgi:hypothetical protein
LIHARTGEGRERAKARGVKMGRKPKRSSAAIPRGSRCARLRGPTTSVTARFHGLRHERHHLAPHRPREEHAPVLPARLAARSIETTQRARKWPGIRPSSQPTDYLGSGPGGPPGIPAGGITGVELGSGTGAGCTICGSTPSAGLMTPPLLSNFSLRLWFPSEVAFPFCVPPSAGRDKSFSGIV